MDKIVVSFSAFSSFLGYSLRSMMYFLTKTWWTAGKEPTYLGFL